MKPWLTYSFNGVLIAVACILLFFITPSLSSNRLAIELWNLGHSALFFIGTLIVLMQLPQQMTKTLVYKIFAISIVIAVATELIQTLMPSRSFSLVDIVNDSIGAFIAINIFLYFNQKISLTNVLITSSLSGIVLLTVTSQLAFLSLDEWRLNKDFPMLADFEIDSEMSRWRGHNIQRTDQKFDSGQHSLKVSIADKKYSGATLRHVNPDWRDFKQLSFSLWANNNTELTLRVHDKQHIKNHSYNDRFNKLLSIKQGWNMVQVDLNDIQHAPKSRQMDMEHIASLGIFSSQPHTIDEFFIDNIRLE